MLPLATPLKYVTACSDFVVHSRFMRTVLDAKHPTVEEKFLFYSAFNKVQVRNDGGLSASLGGCK